MKENHLAEVSKLAKDEKRDVLVAGIDAAIEYAKRFEYQKQERRNAFLMGYLAKHGDAELSDAIGKLLRQLP